ncbi:MAG TPA: TonB family protein [Gemmatimonadaceae bacterium]|nr:TonB family protein [Gemmatimonadaceae bacterium]
MMRTAAVGAVAVAIFVFAVAAGAQAILNGSVTDSAGVGISRAIVSLSNDSVRAVTNERGEFHIEGLTSGTAEVRVRRLGFAPRTERIQLKDAQNEIQLSLVALPNQIAPVVVHAERIRYQGRLAGYYERLERHSSGVFIDRKELDKRNYKSLTQVLSQTPGISAGRIVAGGGSVRLRGRKCPPLVWIDGVPAPAGELDLDGFPVSTIQGIEVYLGATSAPSDYVMPQGLSNCGTILIWSKGPDTEVAALPTDPRVSPERLTESHEVYTADDVDQPARLLNADSLELDYPPPLFASGVEGSVVVEFVVDSAGNIESETYNVVSFTHPLFVRSVTKALERASYLPAKKGGRAVRQLVHQPFSFVRRTGKSDGSG